ncbi:nicotine blue oxidoreductase [Paenarthrobacter nicotinovorans]|jgi:nicotine blue oxidoreductase|nr:nicotine blue oxidoreductase [Paenarthrobacter nicotinovorans]
MVIDAGLRPAVASTVSGDAGARVFLRQKPWLVDLIDCSDESTGEDVDTVEQMYRLL